MLHEYNSFRTQEEVFPLITINPPYVLTVKCTTSAQCNISSSFEACVSEYITHLEEIIPRRYISYVFASI